MDVYRDDKGDWHAGGKPVQIDTKTAGRAILAVGLLLLVFLVSWTSYYTVAPEEKAVVLRFGRYVTTTEPGLHFKLPFGIDRALRVPVTEVRKLEFGFRTKKAGVRTEYADRSKRDEEVALMLTGDLNIVWVEWVVQYQIADPKAWLFHVRDQDRTIHDISQAVMRAVVADHTVNEVIKNRQLLASEVQQKLQERLNEYELGVKILPVQLQDVTPPESVKESFNDVNTAQQERSRLENEAMREYNRVIPLSRGEAKKRIAEAEGYAIDRVNRSHGQIARYSQLLAAYKEAPEVTRKRMYLEAIEQVLPRVERIVVANEEGVLKLLPLDGKGGVR